MIRLFVFFGGLFIFSLSVALIVPPFIDWNQFRDRFEHEASRALGQSVSVLGQSSLRLLPSPSLEFSDVLIGDTDTPFATVRDFRINMELAPLLKGEFEISNMELLSPKFSVRVGEDGYFSFAGEKNLEDTFLEGVPYDNVRFTNIFIQDASLELLDTRFSHTTILEDIDMTASAKSLGGPWRMEGYLNHGSNRLFVRLTTRRLISDSSTRQLPLSLHLSHDNLTHDFDINGTIVFGRGVPRFSGDFRIRPFASPDANVVSGLYYEWMGNLDISTFGILVNEYEVRMGKSDDPYIIEGSAFANFAQTGIEDTSFQITANGQQLSLERLEELELLSLQSSVSPTDIESRLESLHGILRVLEFLPTSGNIKLNLPALVIGDTFIRDIIIEAYSSSDENGWRIRRLEADLPGSTTFLAKGNFQWDGRSLSTLSYYGDLVFATRNLSSFMDWLGSEFSQTIDLGRLGNLTSGGFEATALVSLDSITLDNFELALGESILRGRLDSLLSKARPTIDVSLSGETANLDHLLALVDTITLGDSPSADLFLDLQFSELLIRSRTARDVQARIDYRNDDWLIHSFNIADWGGMDINLTGNLSGKLHGELSMDNSDFFLSLLRDELGGSTIFDTFLDSTILLDESSISFRWRSAGDGWFGNLDLQGSFGTSTMSADIDILDNFMATIELQNPESVDLFRQLGILMLPITDTGMGSLELSLSSLDKESLSVVADLASSSLTARGEGTMALWLPDGSSPSGKFSVSADSMDWGQFFLMTGLSSYGLDTTGEASLMGNLSFDNSGWSIKNLECRLSQYDFGGNIDFLYNSFSRSTISGGLHISLLPFSFFSDLVISEDFVFGGIDGELSLSVDSLVMGDGELPLIAGFASNLMIQDGDLMFGSVVGSLFSGDLSGFVSLGRGAGDGVLSGELSLTSGDVSDALTFAGIDSIATGNFTLSSSFETSDLLDFSFLSNLTMNGSIDITDGNITGINSSSFPLMLADFDSQDTSARDIDARSLIFSHFFTDTYNFGSAGSEFSVARGILRSRMDISDDSLLLGLDIRFDIPQDILQSRMKFSFTSGEESVVGTAPEFFITYRVENTDESDVASVEYDTTGLDTYLALRLGERKEREFVIQRDEILERRRLQRRLREYDLVPQFNFD